MRLSIDKNIIKNPNTISRNLLIYLLFAPLLIFTCSIKYPHTSVFENHIKISLHSIVNNVIIEQNDTKQDKANPIIIKKSDELLDSIDLFIYSTVKEDSYVEDDKSLINPDLIHEIIHDTILYIIKTDKMTCKTLQKRTYVPADLPPIETNIDSLIITIPLNRELYISFDTEELYGDYVVEQHPSHVDQPCEVE